MTMYRPTVTPWELNPADYPQSALLSDRMLFLLRYAALAPSSHNTEPWWFRVRDNTIDLLIDLSRWLKAADDDQRELHISVSCTLENLLVAAEHFGLGHVVEYLPNSDDALGLICSKSDERACQINVGQVYERLCLPAASEGIWTQPMSQIVQVSKIKQGVRALIPTPGLTPQHPFRMGYAEPEDRHTPRRPLEEMLV